MGKNERIRVGRVINRSITSLAFHQIGSHVLVDRKSATRNGNSDR